MHIEQNMRAWVLLLTVLVMIASSAQARWGFELNLGKDRTSVVLTAAAVRFAFAFEHKRPNSDSVRLEIA